MRRSDIFKTLTACIIISEQKQRSAVIERLKAIGIKQFMCYLSLKEAFADFSKFYTVASADFVLTDSTFDKSDSPLSDLPLLVLANGDKEHRYSTHIATISDKELKQAIMNMFKRKFKIC